MNKDIKTISKKVVSSKTFRYGSSAVIFSAVFTAFVVLLNVVVSLIASRTGGLYADITTKQIYSVSEESENALSDTTQNVEIIFCQSRDKVEDDDYLNPIMKLAEQYDRRFSNVEVIFKDRISNPAYFRKFYKTSTDEIYNDSIIVYCEATGLSKVFTINDMYLLNSDRTAIFAFNGENKLTSAICSVARNEEDMLKAGLITGHGENTSQNLQRLLEDCGYETANVDLKAITREELSSYSLLVVCDPMSDFIVTEGENAEGGINEIEKLSDYVMDDFGNVMFFFDPQGGSSEKTNLFELIEERFGVRVNDKLLTIDSSVYDSQNLDFLGTYYSDTESEGYAIHKSISTKNTGIRPAFGPSCLLETASKNERFSVSPIIVTGEDAITYVGENNIQSAAGAPLMTVSTYSTRVAGQEREARVFVCASTGFVTELSNTSFSNNDLFKRCLASMGNENVALDIDFKVLDETSISVTSDRVDSLTNSLVIFVPIIIAIAGVIVFIKRKYL